MRSLAPLRRLRPMAWPLLVTLVLQPLAGAVPAFASMRMEDAASFGVARPIAPADGERVAERALAFVYELPTDAARSWLVVSREPIDASAWRGAPEGEGLVVRDASARPTSLAELGLALERETTLYWTVVSAGRKDGALRATPVRSVTVAPRFENTVQASPFLLESRRGVLSPEEIAANARLRRGVVTPIDRELAGPAVAAEGTAAADAPRLRLAAGYSFAPTVEGEPALPMALTSNRTMTIEDVDPAAIHSYLVLYSDAPSDAERAAIARAGGAVFAYLPDQAFLVRMTSDARARLAAQGDAAWIGEYQPAYKVSPIFEDATVPQGDEWKALLFPDASLDAAAEALTGRGFAIANRSDNGVNKMLRFRTPAGVSRGEALARVAGLSAVAWVEPVTPKVLENVNAQWVVQTNVNGDRRVWTQGIRGQGQIVMTSDSGIQMLHDQFRDPAVPMLDFGDYVTHRKVIAYKKGSTSPDVTFGDHSGAAWHGSHTGCSMVGWDDPVGGVATQDGMAKEAKIYFMDISGPALANGVFPFDDLNDLFTPPYVGNAAGAARISSNSWGSAVSGQYTLDALALDQFVWTHPDMYIAFSNGNSGTAGSVGSPATAKNVAGMGGTQNGVNAALLYTSTSRGPTQDGRRKPLICSPGQTISSAQGTTPTSYGFLSGTSMASPTGTGAVTLMRQYLTDGWYPTGAAVPANGFAPSAALLKAMAINAADNAVTGQVAPNNNVGFGRIKIDNVLWFAGDVRKTLLADQTDGLAQGQFVEYQVNVTESTIPLEVSLCWNDYPGNPAGGVQLVNNLDLTVTNGISTYRGNSFTSGFSNTNNVVDILNVEENVLINNPPVGVWTVRIAAPTVPVGPQPFGLCITGGVGQTAGALALDRAEYGSSSTVEIQVTDTNAGGPFDVNVTSPTEPGGQLVSLSGGNGVFTGTLQLTSANPNGADGLLSVSHGDAITATYSDASPVAAIVAQATVSYGTPLITNVKATSQGAAGTLITWNTDRNASSRVDYGLTPALELGSVEASEARLAHSMLLTGLTPGATYYYDVESEALNGNATRDDAGGPHYKFTAKGSGDILFVLGDAAYPRVSAWTLAFAATNYDYDTWSGPLADNPVLGDRDSGLRSYKAVVWQTGLESYPPFSDLQRTVVTDYLNGGGRLAVVGHDIAWAFGDPTSPVYTADRQLWLQNTLRTTWQADPLLWNQMNGYVGDPISGPNSAGVSYEPFRSGGAGDEVDIAVTAGGTSAYTFRNTEATPDDCGFRWESGVPNGSPLTALWGGAPSRLVTGYYEFSSMDPPFSAPSAVRDGILDRTLVWLFGRARPVIVVTAPNGGEVLTANSVNITWNETLGLGVNADSRTIEYSVDGGDSWTTLTTSAGPSPYAWDLTAVPNTNKGRVRVRVVDDGTPAPLAQSDASNSNFTINREGGDVLGPVVVAGSIIVSPNPVVRPNPATLSASISDATTGASNVAAAEWSFGASAAAAGAGTALPLSGAGITRPASGSIDTTPFATGAGTLWVRGQDSAGNWGPASALEVQVNGPELVGIGDVPRLAFLDQNRPNPFARQTAIRFGLAQGGRASIGVFDVQGRRVRSLVDGDLPAGEHAVSWDGIDDQGRQAAAGVYFYVFRAEGRNLQKRMMLLP
jgi:hypothetical protein